MFQQKINKIRIEQLGKQKNFRRLHKIYRPEKKFSEVEIQYLKQNPKNMTFKSNLSKGYFWFGPTSPGLLGNNGEALMNIVLGKRCSRKVFVNRDVGF